ncbi:DUF1934 domain-containing protein [Aerococcus kribbianus]|uniref:DUF1934 domain-containing protein n=1 Tax=Aerococcus kribbianus TaxID=2999064 RepID=A0A9X3FQ25_9LACT|nr:MULTISPECIES: DUF1934 domain-containing protein [unclassified Aerococcus]MCZ0717894.1 DUF1934 domain-containing protein [Aerococcus sp. YH-aer221]MCZ0726181.1 DUF1934 domain-containing protein [Aerococcus sp. YH-aer222]
MNKQPIEIKASSEIINPKAEGGGQETFNWESSGHYFQVGETHYITYQEEWEGQKSQVRIKLNANKDLTIQRQFDQSKIIMPFSYQTPTLIYYPIFQDQALEFEGFLKTVDYEELASDWQALTIAYQLSQDDHVLGHYKIRLQYRPIMR